MKRKQILALLLSATLVMGITSPVYAEDSGTVQATTEPIQEAEADEVIKEEVPAPEETLPPKEEQAAEQPEVVDSIKTKEAGTAETTEAESLAVEDIVTVPDAKLKKALLEECDKNKDEELSKAEMEAVTSLYLMRGNMSEGERLDLTGIEHCLNITSLNISRFICDNTDKLMNLGKMQSLTLYDCGIADTSFTKGMPKLEDLSLYDNKSVDMDSLKDLSQMTSLNLTGCNVKDISLLSKMVELKHLSLTDNQISDISVLKYLTKIETLYLGNNSILDISAVSDLNFLGDVELSGNTGITDISVLEKHKKYIRSVGIWNNANITKEYLFKTFVNPKITTMVGNEIGLGMGWIKKINISTGNLEEKDIEWKVDNTEIATVTKDFSIIGKTTGKAKLIGTIGSTTKTFDIEVAGLESKVVEASSTTSMVDRLPGDACAVLDSKKVLWSINNDKTEKVKTGVQSYIANLIYGVSKEECWGQYYALDTNNSLWDCNKKTKGDAYTTEKIFANVKEYDPEYVLLYDGKLYKMSDSKTPVGENIASYYPIYNYDKGYSIDDIVLNTSKQLINRATGQVYLTDVDEVRFAWNNTYLGLKDNTLHIYRKEGAELKQYEAVEGISEISTSNFVKTDGSVWSWTWDLTSSGTQELKLEKKWDREPLYHDSRFILNTDHVLSVYDAKGELLQTKEGVKAVVTNNYGNGSPARIHMNDGEYLEYVEASNDWRIVATNVKKAISPGTFYITSDNALYQITSNGTHNKVMTDVRDAVEAIEDCYIIRTDNSVWRYCSFASGNGKPYLVKEGDKPAPPVDEVFKDVPVGQWFNEYVQFVYENNIMTGLDAANFGPSETLARAQFAVILYRLSGEPKIEYTPKFKDVPEGQWYTSAVLWANQAGIVTGYSSTGLFGTSDRINREQMAVMMYRYAKYQKYDISQMADFGKFKDAASVNDFAKEAMKWAVGAGIITGKDNGTRIDPQGDANRAECATIIMRFMKLYV